MKSLLKTTLILWALLFWAEASAQGAGAQTNFLLPVGMHGLVFTYTDVDSNFRFGQTGIGKADIVTTSASAKYAYNFELAGRFASISAAAAYVSISGKGDIKPPVGPPLTLTRVTHGMGDPSVSFRVGLVGAPALNFKQWLEYDKGFQMYFHTGLSIPVGEYTPTRLLNPGFNRWSADFSLPMVLPLDRARRTTFLEITPRVFLFDANTEPFRPARRQSQDPLYVIEVQASHALTPRLWMGLGVQYQVGGATATDGVQDNNELDQFYGEAGVGYRVGGNLVLAATYGKIFGQENDARGDVWRARAILAF